MGRIQIVKDGPYLVSGNIPLAKETLICNCEGTPQKWEMGEKYPEKKSYALCRCGQSKNKPYCDGTHLEIDFDGTETASPKGYNEEAETITGPDLILTDSPKLCAGTRFCYRVENTWDLTKNSSDPASRNEAIAQACDCPSGRLVAWDKKTGKPIEPHFEPSISLTENAGKKALGPIWVKGGVPIESSEGTEYEIRNRVTLCRCGQSKNKPFCDGTHDTIGFCGKDLGPSE